MRDFPVFNTAYGVASLVLRQIPYRQEAYITILDSLEPDKLLEECVDFCRACGAEKVFARGHACLEKYPLETALWEMVIAKEQVKDTDAAIFPVQKKTLEDFRQIYNKKVVNVPCGSWMSQADGEEMLQKAAGYFVHRGEELLGIGIVGKDRLEWVASCQKGAGETVVQALCHGIWEDTVRLTVASENKKALELYRRMGFVAVKEECRWYRVK